MLKSFGVTYVILGHSERRNEGESDAMVNKRLHAVIGEDLTAIVCVGERVRDHAAQYLNFIEMERVSRSSSSRTNPSGRLALAIMRLPGMFTR
jgi:triosephosphate isomerase